MPRIVVLGTGTGVGKTYFAVALARALAGPGKDTPVLALKPVETGFQGSPRARSRSDAARLSRASTPPSSIDRPLFGFRPPVSPHLAAKRSKQPISLTKILKWVATSERSTTLHDTALRWTILETAGGALSPLTPRHSNADLASALDPAIWILIAPDALGVLHDVRSTLLALRQVARAPDFVVLTAARARDASVGTNAAELARLGIAEPIATFSRGADPRRALRRLVSALRAFKAR